MAQFCTKYKIELIAICWTVAVVYFGVAGYTSGQSLPNVGMLCIGWIFGSAWSKARNGS